MWIVPRAHQAEFGATSQVERSALAEVVGDALQRLRDLAGNPPYNLMIHSSRRTRSGSPAFHWFLQIRPRSAQSAGFELASGIRVNASSPERDARILRGEGEWGGEKPSL
jgi:UDPglucose--hexose-1-phosphate uridylyltransferase